MSDYQMMTNSPEENKRLLDEIRAQNFRKKCHSTEAKLKEFQPWVLEALQKHVEEGWSIASFTGTHHVDHSAFYHWLDKIPEMNEIRRKYNERKWREGQFWRSINGVD